MKKLITMVVVLALIGLFGAGTAQGKDWGDLSWWGNTGATPAPVKDSTRSGYWWWPKQAASNANDSELWGNRGLVYNVYQPKAEKPEEPTAKGPDVKRQIPVLNNVLFDFDKSVLKPEGKAETDKVVNYMKQFPKDTCVVEGHTCNIGTDQYNMGLGQRRADAVMKYMVDNGIEQARVKSVSKGETQPAVPNDTPANRKLNRRVVFNIAVSQ